MEERARLWPVPSHVATPLEVLEGGGEPARTGSGYEQDHLLKEGLIARDGERALVVEPVLLLRLQQKLLEEGVV